MVNVDFYGEGGPKFQPVYVGDVAQAIMVALSDPKTEGAIFELGGPRVYSFKELMELLLAVTGRKRLLLPVPLFSARFMAWFLEKWPKPLLTRDQVRLMEKDNVSEKAEAAFKELGIEPVTAEVILPTYLRCFRLHKHRVRRRFA